MRSVIKKPKSVQFEDDSINSEIEKLSRENDLLKHELKAKTEIIERFLSYKAPPEKTPILREPNDNKKINKNKKVKEVSKNDKKNAEQRESKRVEIVGDSILNGIEENGLKKIPQTLIKVRKHPGATSIDILDHIRPVIRRKPNHIIIHAGTNDITKGINYLKNVKIIAREIQEESPSTKVSFSSLMVRTDIENGLEQVVEINARLKNFCMQNELGFIDNSPNIKEESLGKKKLHPNKKGTSLLVRNFLNYLS